MESTAQRDRFTELLDAAAQVSEQGELHGLLESLVDIAIGLTGAQFGALGVVGSHGFLVDFIHRGIDPDTAEQIGHLPLGLGVLGT
ncbi:MAG: histidine kinase, partial [Actinomycetota bacterium]|nr:histidine kinase [Actinomycetota bacterium]